MKETIEQSKIFVNVKKYLLRFAGIAIFLLGFIALYKCFDYVINDNVSSQTRVTLHDFYEQESIDYLFVGSSHTIRAINAPRMSEALGKNVFNLGTSYQDAAEGYYLIKEAIASKNINTVFYEVSFSRLSTEKSDMISAGIIADYLHSYVSRLDLILHCVSKEQILQGLSAVRREVNPQEPFNRNDLNEVYEKKQSSDYKNYLGDDNYRGKGYWKVSETYFGEDTSAINLNSESLCTITVDEITDSQWNYLYKMIELCRKNNVELVFVIPPYFDSYLDAFLQYDLFADKLSELAQNNNIEMLDLNRIRNEYVNLSISDYRDSEHVNVYGADKISDFLCQYIKDPTNNYFCESNIENHIYKTGIRYIGYNRYFVTDNGEYLRMLDDNNEPIYETVKRLHIQIVPKAYEDINTLVRIWKVDDITENCSSFGGVEIEGKRIDGGITDYIVPVDDYKTNYLIKVFDSDTKEVLAETVTNFSMN